MEKRGAANGLLAGILPAARTTPGPIAVFLALVLVVGFGKLASILYGALYGRVSPLLGDAAFYVLVFAPVLAFLFVWVRLYERRRFVSLFGDITHPVRKAVRGLLVGVSLMAGTVFVLILVDAVSLEGSSEGAVQVTALGGVVAAAILIWAFPAIAEEVLARGWLLQTLGARRGPAVAVTVSALTFVLWHWLLDTSLGLLSLANLALAGVFWSLYALTEGSLVGVCVAHAAYNWSETNLFGFGLFGSDPAGGSLVNFEESGPDILTGGGVGLNTTGGLAFSLVQLVALIALVLVARRNRGTVKAAKQG